MAKNKVEGTAETVIKLGELEERLERGAIQGINLGLERIRTAAVVRAPKYVGKPNPRIVPGFLRASAFVRYLQPGQLVSEGGIVGFGAIYARRQHYETGWHHSVGEALYLRHGAEYVLPLIPFYVADAVHAALLGK